MEWRASMFTLSLALLAGCVGEITDEELDPEVALAVGPPKAIVRHGSGKCLDVNAAGTANGTKIQQWGCNGTAAQAFALDERGGGVVRLVNSGSGKCVDVAGGATGNGTKVQLWSCNTTGAQKWRLESVGGGYSRLVNTKSGKCLDVSGGGSGDGVQVQIWSCNGGSAQSWKLADAGGGDDGDDGGDDGGGGGLTWRTANLTNFTSYPDPGSDECENYNGCQWAGYFAFVDGQQSENWVMTHNIAAVHSKDADQYALKTLRLRQGAHEIDVKVYDMCADSDCDGCCTQNSSQTGFLIDIESYTMDRFGSGDGLVDWACLDCP